MEKKISKATMSRFPVYLKALRKMQHEGKETCLSSELFEITGIVDFTHSHFMVQEGVEVQTVDVVVAIQELVIKMKSNDQE